MELLSPFNVAGTKFVIGRPLEHARGDQINSYLALRATPVRQGAVGKIHGHELGLRRL